MNFKSSFLQEFYQRGFYANCTNNETLDNILTKQKISVYIGFDCTANSLHAGSLLQIMILRLLQKHGHQPIILLGGGTTKIGDPSGKDQTRQILTHEKITQNLKEIKKTLEKFLDFSSYNKAIIVNNDDWLKDLNYINFLRDIGRHFSINRMLSFDSVKLRLEREQNLSFLEFNYMIFQAYDFYKLSQTHNCILQIGGSDQWGNIVNGVELTRKITFASDENKSKEVFGLTSPLLTTASGNKMGKTVDGAIWLDEKLLEPYDYFQYFRNIDDKDVGKFLRLFTDLNISKINDLEKLKDQEINKAKEILAFEATKICHGQEKADQVLKKAQEIFINNNISNIEQKNIDLEDGKKLSEIIKICGASQSLSQSKNLIQGNAVKINDNTISDINYKFESPIQFNLQIGKKKFFNINLFNNKK